ncbi:hypothetical protein [uncultured Methanobrevibacter sp.]|uniref:hypothetical protein n=1 Tax=uncultured Methanobrevibacter sp. TaxID=253161 RepID=UPI0025CD6332|nr:hypothetical protein [uncultured Methanobrevibacter sp.]
MRRRRRRSNSQKKLMIGFVVLIVGFGLGSTIGISMGFTGDEKNVVQNNTTHMPVDVTNNISLYENKSMENMDNYTSEYNQVQSNDVNYDYSDYGSDNYDYSYDSSYDDSGSESYYETDGYSEDYNNQTTDVDSSQYY